jgi:hypothetical protein
MAAISQQRVRADAAGGTGDAGHRAQLVAEPGSCVDFDRLEAELGGLCEAYAAASPYPHIALDGLLTPEVARRAIAEFPSVDSENWINFVHSNERKFSNVSPATWPPTLQAVWRDLSSPRFLAFLSALTGIEGLMSDETLEGGGLHQTRPGGFLNVHADFRVHPRKPHWQRRCNVVLYLNDEWRPEYGGDLEIWNRDMSVREHLVAPLGNRAVIFTTGAETWHGHPDPLRCPPGVARRSLALFHYTYEEHPEGGPTVYRARPGDGPVKRLGIYSDNLAVMAYDWVKRRVGLSDKWTAARFLGDRHLPPPGAMR